MCVHIDTHSIHTHTHTHTHTRTHTHTHTRTHARTHTKTHLFSRELCLHMPDEGHHPDQLQLLERLSDAGHYYPGNADVLGYI